MKTMRGYASAFRRFFALSKISQSLMDIVAGHGPLTTIAAAARTVAARALISG
jgi:hypothetical protein